MKTPAALILAVALALAGCVTTGTTGHAATKLTVQYATIKVLDKNPAYAARAAEIAGTVRKAASGEASTVDTLIALARAEIQWGELDAADSLLLNELLNFIAAELRQRVGDGPIAGDKGLAVAEFASWIEQAAKQSRP